MRNEPDERDEPDQPMLSSIPVGSPAHKKLAEAMRVLRDQAPDAQSARIYDDILSGRRSARDLTESEDFARVAQHGLARHEEDLDGLDETARAELQAQAQAEAEQLDRRPGT